MEIFFKKYFWTLNVAVVLLAGVVTARTVSALAAASLAEAPTVQAPATERPRATPAAPPRVSDEALAAVFGLRLPEPEPTGEVPDLPPPGTEVPSSLNATLVATLEAVPDTLSLAVITDNTARVTRAYGIGDDLMDRAEVVKVERRRVLIRHDGRTEYLEMDDEAAPAAAPAPRPGPVAAAPEAPTGEGIRKVGEGEYVIERGELEGALSNLNAIATQARIVPAFKNGVAQGFKLFSIRPGSIYAKLGIQNGDVIKQVNGYDLNSPDKALEIYSRLQSESDFKLVIERRGRTENLSYSVQ